MQRAWILKEEYHPSKEIEVWVSVHEGAGNFPRKPQHIEGGTMTKEDEESKGTHSLSWSTW